MPSCGTCKFFVLWPNSKSVGNCVRYPPKVHVMMEDSQNQTDSGSPKVPVPRGYFPPVSADRWCGEWVENPTLPDDWRATDLGRGSMLELDLDPD